MNIIDECYRELFKEHDADHRGPDSFRSDSAPHPHPAGRGPGKHHSPDSSGDAARSSGLAGGDPDHPWPQKPVSTAILGAIPVTTISGQRVGSPVTPGQTVTARTPQRKGMDSRALRPKEELDLWEIRAFAERVEKAQATEQAKKRLEQKQGVATTTVTPTGTPVIPAATPKVIVGSLQWTPFPFGPEQTLELCKEQIPVSHGFCGFGAEADRLHVKKGRRNPRR